MLMIKAEQLRRAIEVAAGEPTDRMQVIIRQVAQTLHVPHQALLNGSKRHPVVMARWVAFDLCRELLGAGLEEIAEGCGRAHHTTVLYALQELPDRLLQDQHLAQQACSARAACIAALRAAGIAIAA